MWNLIASKQFYWKMFLETLTNDTLSQLGPEFDEVEVPISNPGGQKSSMRGRFFLTLRKNYKKYYDFIGLVPGVENSSNGPIIFVIHSRIYRKHVLKKHKTSEPKPLYVLKNPSIQQLQQFIEEDTD